MGGILMNKNNKFSIGEFSEKTGVSIRTLHYYDEIGLLKPEKNPSSGHRIYNCQDIIILQKILSLKLLGYSLDEITGLVDETKFTVDLNESLSLQLQALEIEKEQFEQSMKSIKRVINIVEEEGEVDSTLLFSLISSMHTEQIQWMERHNLTDVAKELSKKSEEDKIALDKLNIKVYKEVKKLYGKSLDDSEVQLMIHDYLEGTFSFLGEELMQKLADTNVEEVEIQEMEDITSPFTEEEQEWFNQALEYYMKHTEMK